MRVLDQVQTCTLVGTCALSPTHTAPPVPAAVPASAATVHSLLRRGRHEELLQLTLRDLAWAETELSEGRMRKEKANSFLRVILPLISDQGFKLLPPHSLSLVHRNAFLSTLVAHSSFGQADGFFHASEGSLDAVNFLTLYSPRSRLWVSPAYLLQTNPQAMAIWFRQAVRHVRTGCLVDEDCSLFLRKLMRSVGPQYLPLPMPSNPHKPDLHDLNLVYFASTYIDPLHDKPTKQMINRIMQTAYPGEDRLETGKFRQFTPSKSRPARIAVVSGSWLNGHSVYRNFRGIIDLLTSDPCFVVTLIFLGEPGTEANGEAFHEVYYMPWETHQQLQVDMQWITRQAFDILFYSAIGMHIQSLLLANHRLAPIQVSAYGHSASTMGAYVDYWIGGKEAEWLPVEVDASAHHPNYSEILVLVRGFGIVHERIDGEHVPAPALSAPLSRTPQQPFILTCAWSLSKLNWRHLQLIRNIIQEVLPQAERLVGTGSPLAIRFLLINADEHQTAQLLLPLLRKALRFDRVEIQTGLRSADYLLALQQGHLLLGSDYGECNTIIDALVTQTPMVLLEGMEWRNRIGPAMLRRAGLEDMVATTKEEYVRKAVRFIRGGLVGGEDAWANAVKRLRGLDLEQLFFDTDEGAPYVSAFKHLVQHHEDIQMSGLKIVDLA